MMAFVSESLAEAVRTQSWMVGEAGAVKAIDREKVAPKKLDPQELDRALIAAHEGSDLTELVRLYTAAGDLAEQESRIDAACFYLTHAFVFALESGAPQADRLNQRLADRGRAHRLQFS